MMGLYNFSSCQADIMRSFANDLDERADDLDGDDDIDLGDYLADLFEDL
jgi:hypothetical protein